jgi:NAD(P)-dependent dehydrogenase (short-subunit alcohol dehydrogenase family)
MDTTTKTPAKTPSAYNYSLLSSFTPTYHHDVYPFISETGPLKDSQAGKTVLITGAGRGIGRACAEAFAVVAGARCLVLVARTEAQLLEVKSEIIRKLRELPPATNYSNNDNIKEGGGGGGNDGVKEEEYEANGDEGMKRKEALVLTFAVDLSKDQEVERLWQELKKKQCVPDVLFNNAGKMEDPGCFDSVEIGDWWSTFVGSPLLRLV